MTERMRLYYMTEAKWAKKILQEQRFKLARVNELNDPFEFLCPSVGNKEARHVAKAVRDYLHEDTGILCTGASYDSPVMWAHYGHKHEGVCLGFDFLIGENLAPAQVKYEPERVEGFFDGIFSGSPITQDHVKMLFTTKYHDWAYEKEWRLFGHLGTPDNGLHYFEFEPSIRVREVILGARCEETVQDFAALVTAVEPVEVFKLRGAFNRFAMVRQQQVEPIIVMPK